MKAAMKDGVQEELKSRKRNGFEGFRETKTF